MSRRIGKVPMSPVSPMRQYLRPAVIVQGQFEGFHRRDCCDRDDPDVYCCRFERATRFAARRFARVPMLAAALVGSSGDDADERRLGAKRRPPFALVAGSEFSAQCRANPATGGERGLVAELLRHHHLPASWRCRDLTYRAPV